MFEVTGMNYDSVLHVAENLRPEDWREVIAGRGDEDDWEDELATYIGRNASFGLVARKDDEPVAVFCAVPLRPGVWQAHRYATDRWPEVSYSLSKVIKSEFLPVLRAVGARRVQHAAMDGNADTHSWIEWCGFDRGEELPGAGRNGETFVEFAKVWRN